MITSMTRRPVAELSGAALNWAVQRCEPDASACALTWQTIGPIIEREGVALRRHRSGIWYAIRSADLGNSQSAQWSAHRWVSATEKRAVMFTGVDAVEAAARCYVAHKLGERVDVPREWLPDEQA